VKIPVFVSAPTSLSAAQEGSRKLILRELERNGLESRALGRTDYPTELPLREVLTIAKHCAGGVILGFQQIRADSGVRKPDTKDATTFSTPMAFPTAWNHLEAGIIFSLGLPLLVFKEPFISGGIFDNGVTDVFVHEMPDDKMTLARKRSLQAVFLKWQAEVRNCYYKK
jgi:hypothetical protein